MMDFDTAFAKLDTAFTRASNAEFGPDYRRQRLQRAIQQGPEEYFFQVANMIGSSDPNRIWLAANKFAAGGDYAE